MSYPKPMFRPAHPKYARHIFSGRGYDEVAAESAADEKKLAEDGWSDWPEGHPKPNEPPVEDNSADYLPEQLSEPKPVRRGRPRKGAK